jgi:uncharacterized membrane protein YeaQ/YmgE (transglycosylase-associated protein family)
MAIFAYIILGIVVGVIVRIAMPPAPQVGFWGSVLLGMVGGLVGGLINSPFQNGGNVLERVTPGGLALAALIATAVTVGATIITRRRRFA